MANSRNFTTQGLALYDRARNAFSNLNQNLQQPNPYGGIGGAEGLTRVGLSMIGAAPQGLSAALEAAGETKSGIADYNRTLQQADQDRLLRLQLANMDNMARENVAMINQSNKAGSFRPDLTTYQNTNDFPVNINGIELQAGESRSFNESDPAIATALMNTAGMQPVFKEGRPRGLSLYRTGNNEPYQSYFDGSGELVFEGKEGIFTSDEFFQKFPEARTSTAQEGYRYNLPVQNFYKLDDDITNTEKSFEQLENYWNSIKNSNVGLARLGDQISQWYKTIQGETNLTFEELERAEASGELQSLIGANRIDTVGGGVMTEKDAWRVMEALGGDVTMLQNPAVVAEQLEKMYNLKLIGYNRNVKKYNNEVATGNFKGFKERKPIDRSRVYEKFSLVPEGVHKRSRKVDVGDPNNPIMLWYDAELNKYYTLDGTDEVEID